MKLLICGIKYIKDLQVCINAGVDYIELNFYNKSKRCCKNGDILNLINDIDLKNSKLVALFYQNTIEEIDEALKLYKINIIKLYDYNLIEKYYNKYTTILGISGYNEDVKKAKCDKILIDASLGAGFVMDYDNLTKIISKINKPFGIAGGINESNIVSFKNKYPNADFLDLASGVEENGLFSEDKLYNLVKLFNG